VEVDSPHVQVVAFFSCAVFSEYHVFIYFLQIQWMNVTMTHTYSQCYVIEHMCLSYELIAALIYSYSSKHRLLDFTLVCTFILLYAYIVVA